MAKYLTSDSMFLSYFSEIDEVGAEAKEKIYSGSQMKCN